MQKTIFRLPWSSVEIPTLKDTKRKRIDSLDASPKDALLVKKLKSESDGAVQPVSPPVGAARSLQRPNVTVDGPEKSALVPGNGNPAPLIGNVNVRLVKEKETEKELAAASLTSSPASATAPVARSAPTPSTTFSPKDAVKVEPTRIASPQSNVDKLRAIIEAQINLEILQKHNELRLIEQELAKCQISMEQLRRCELMPYPGTSGPSQEVTRGVGKAVKSPNGYSEPEHPAPWGVTDGPYARHYAKWLIPDASFDPRHAQQQQYHVGTPMVTRGNRVRGNAFDFVLPAPPVRTSRASTGTRESSGTATGRDPMIMKRQQDGQWVRLRCSVCQRINFNNIQGFLNHCRIAHHQDYKSHEAAAIACGEAITPEEANAAAAAEPAQTPAPTPARTMSMTLPAATPAVQPLFVSMPLVTPTEQPHVNPLAIQPPTHRPLDRVLDLSSNVAPKPSLLRSSMSPGLNGSVMPHLSSLMQRRGLSTSDLSAFVADTQKKVDLSMYDDSESEHESEAKFKKQHQKKKSKSGSSVSSAAPTPTAAARPKSAKGISKRQAPTFAVAPPSAEVGYHPSVFQRAPDTPSDGDVEMEMSPGTAPGLVSDHEDDYDEADEAKSANGSTTDVVMEDVEIRDSDEERENDRKRMSLGGSEDGQVCRHATAGASIH